MTFVFKTGDKNEDGVLELNDLVKVFEMPRRPVIEEDNTIERIYTFSSQIKLFLRLLCYRTSNKFRG